MTTIIEEKIGEFENAFVNMSPFYGRDMHNQPPLYNTDLREVESIKNFLRTALTEAYEMGRKVGMDTSNVNRVEVIDHTTTELLSDKTD